MKTLKFLAIVLPICAILVACDGKKSEPTDPTELAVTAQDLCDYLPYTVDGKEYVYKGKNNREYHLVVKSADIDTLDNKGKVEVVFTVTSPSYPGKVLSEQLFSSETYDNKQLTLSFFGRFGNNYGWCISGHTMGSRSEFLQKEEIDMDEGMPCTIVELKKGIISFPGLLSDDGKIKYTLVE